MPEVDPFPRSTAVTTRAGPDDAPTIPPADGTPIRAFGGVASAPKLSANRGEDVEIAPFDTDSSNNADVDDDTEREMDVHTPPTHDDRTATHPADADGAERGWQESLAPPVPTPLADTSPGDGPFTSVTALSCPTAT